MAIPVLSHFKPALLILGIEPFRAFLGEHHLFTGPIVSVQIAPLGEQLVPVSGCTPVTVRSPKQALALHQDRLHTVQVDAIEHPAEFHGCESGLEVLGQVVAYSVEAVGFALVVVNLGTEILEGDPGFFGQVPSPGW